MTSVSQIRDMLNIGETRNQEFKRRLTKADLKTERRQKLVTRIRFMTCEAPFEGVFLLGIEDLGGKEWKVYGLTEQGIKLAEEVLEEICKEADVEIVEGERIEAAEGLVGRYLLKRIAAPEIKQTCSVNVAGRVNSGKSTMIGALVTGRPDDGSGKTRSFLLKHPQEITRGQTADIHLTFMGFTEEGDSIHLENPLSKEEAARVLDRSAKILTFFDAPGHKEYSKTMIRSILGADAQYGLVLIPAPEEANLVRAGLQREGRARLDDITREHLLLMANQGAPFIVLISKTDKASLDDLEVVQDIVRSTLKEIGRIPVNIKTHEEIGTIAREIEHGAIVPILEFAATSRDSLNILTELLFDLPAYTRNLTYEKPARSYIDKVYRGIRGTNVVITGTVRSGVFKKGQEIVIGPNENGEFSSGRLFSIEMFKKRVASVRSGDLFGFDIKDVDKHVVRRGQVVSDPDDTIRGCRAFEANIVVTRHPTRISEGYSPVLQCHTIQHTVILRKIYNADYLSVGDFARVQLEFMLFPEPVEIGDKIVLREANTRAIGTIVEIIN